MLWGYTMFPSGGFSTKPYYISRIEDKNGNVLARFDTERKEVISQTTAYTMCRMMQGPVDIGTAPGLRNRLGISEMGGKTGTTNDNSDAWFIGYTPQLLAGVWIGCDDRFIRLESKSRSGRTGGTTHLGIFFCKTLADKTLGLKNSKICSAGKYEGDMMYDYYMNIIDKTHARRRRRQPGQWKCQSVSLIPVHPTYLSIQNYRRMSRKYLKEANRQ